MDTDIFLNEKQSRAAMHKDGPMMVIAGPGSGKTTVIMHRVKNLIKNYNINPNEILVITFTKAAADEMKKRFEKIMINEKPGVTFVTFHSFFFRIIRRFYNYGLENVLGEDGKFDVIKAIINSLGIDIDEADDFLQSVINELSSVNNELIDIQYHNPIGLPSDSFRQIAALYEEWKNENNKIDFDDMQIKCYNLLKENKSELSIWRRRYKYIMIDEFQDINRVQYEIIKSLAKPLENIFVVGDDDQSIYRFRGSRPEFLLNFSKDFPAVENVVLDVNYRSTDSIINISNRVISENKNRFSKNIRGTGSKGGLPVMLYPESPREEAFIIAGIVNNIAKKTNPSEIAVVYRTNIQARPIIDAFMDMRIPFRIKDDAPSIYEHWISKDILAYFKLALERYNNKAFERIANKPKRYISKAGIALARKKSGSILANLYDDKSMPLWQKNRLEELMFYLNALKTRNACDAIKYLRQGIGYDEYLKEYAEYRGINPKGLFEILAELQEAAAGHDDIAKYIDHVEKVIDKIKEDKTARKKNMVLQDAVTLSTMHGVKGLEYDTVFIISVIEGIVPHEKSKTPPEIEEECRMLYVAMTRAKNNLYISSLKLKKESGHLESRFLKAIGSNLYMEG